MSYATLEHYQYGGPTPPDCEQRGNKNYGNCWSCEKNKSLGKNYCLWHMPGDIRITGTVYSSKEDCLNNKCTDGEMPEPSPCGALNCYSYEGGKCSLSATGTSIHPDCKDIPRPWQSPTDEGTTVSWTCGSGNPHATYQYYNNEKDLLNSCNASCTGKCSPVCTSPNTPGGQATPGKLTCVGMPAIGRPDPTLVCAGQYGDPVSPPASVDSKKANCRVFNIQGDWKKGCDYMISKLYKSGDDTGAAYLAPGATCKRQGGEGNPGMILHGVDG